MLPVSFNKGKRYEIKQTEQRNDKEKSRARVKLRWDHFSIGNETEYNQIIGPACY